MQTFVPYADMYECARVLDNRRLGNQRRECLTLLGALDPVRGNGWKNHPAAKMWRGYEPALRLYLQHILEEWVGRGFNNSVESGINRFPSYPRPPWWGDEGVHSSHRAALLHKDPEWYGRWRWKEKPGLHYVWPAG